MLAILTKIEITRKQTIFLLSCPYLGTGVPTKSAHCTDFRLVGKKNCVRPPSKDFLSIKNRASFSTTIFSGWGGRIWTYACESQSLVPYRLATPHHWVKFSLLSLQISTYSLSAHRFAREFGKIANIVRFSSGRKKIFFRNFLAFLRKATDWEMKIFWWLTRGSNPGPLD